jgi:thioredoxin-dependent peroxiredoxin
MKIRLLTSALIAAMFSLSAQAALETGAAAPSFTTQASMDGEEFTYSLQQSLNLVGPTVVYFYPSAYTQGCNIQAHTFAINMEKFHDAGATVVGVSLDSIERLNDFSADPEFCAGELPVASDLDGSIARSYGLDVRDGRPGFKDTRGVDVDHGFISRDTFVVGADGTIMGTVGGVSPEENVMKSLEIVESIASR